MAPIRARRMKCQRCGLEFRLQLLHTVHIVVDRDYNALALDERMCTDCLMTFLNGSEAPVKPASPQLPPASPPA